LQKAVSDAQLRQMLLQQEIHRFYKKRYCYPIHGDPFNIDVGKLLGQALSSSARIFSRPGGQKSSLEFF